MNNGRWLLVALLFAMGLPAHAQQMPPSQAAPPATLRSDRPPGATQPGAAQAVPWSSLSPEQQRLLGHLAPNWSSLAPQRQQALARGSDRWLGMSAQQRAQAQQRYQQWHALPPDERRVLRDRWEKFQSLPPNEQSAVRQNFRRFQDLPPDKRQVLREQWRNASPAQRQHMIEQSREQRTRRLQLHAAPPPRPHH